MTLTFLKSTKHFSYRRIWLLNPSTSFTHWPGSLWSGHLADELPTKTLNPSSSLQENYEWVFDAGILMSHWKTIQRKVNIGSDTKELCPPSAKSTVTQGGVPLVKHNGNVIQEKKGGQSVPCGFPCKLKNSFKNDSFANGSPSGSPESSFVLSWLRAAEFVTSQEDFTCQEFWLNLL